MVNYILEIFDEASLARKKVLWDNYTRKTIHIDIDFTVQRLKEGYPISNTMLENIMDETADIHQILDAIHPFLEEKHWKYLENTINTAKATALSVHRAITIAAYTPYTNELRNTLLNVLKDEFTIPDNWYVKSINKNGIDKLLIGDENDDLIIQGFALAFITYNGNERHLVHRSFDAVKEVYEHALNSNNKNVNKCVMSNWFANVGSRIKSDELKNDFLSKWVAFAKEYTDATMQTKIYEDIDSFYQKINSDKRLNQWRKQLNIINNGPSLGNIRTTSSITVSAWLKISSRNAIHKYIKNISAENITSFTREVLYSFFAIEDSTKNDIKNRLTEIRNDIDIYDQVSIAFYNSQYAYMFKDSLLFAPVLLTAIAYIETNKDDYDSYKDRYYQEYSNMMNIYEEESLYRILKTLYPEYVHVWSNTLPHELLACAYNVLCPEYSHILDSIKVSHNLGITNTNLSIIENVQRLISLTEKNINALDLYSDLSDELDNK